MDNELNEDADKEAAHEAANELANEEAHDAVDEAAKEAAEEAAQEAAQKTYQDVCKDDPTLNKVTKFSSAIKIGATNSFENVVGIFTIQDLIGSESNATLLLRSFVQKQKIVYRLNIQNSDNEPGCLTIFQGTELGRSLFSYLRAQSINKLSKCLRRIKVCISNSDGTVIGLVTLEDFVLSAADVTLQMSCFKQGGIPAYRLSVQNTNDLIGQLVNPAPPGGRRDAFRQFRIRLRQRLTSTRY